ncbi:hypothetical protein C8J57DRAFT_1532099 [Mycena rebaudengoi]|nr:hypothetical protein C8J57DRAFT_1532099 [Mycena rebaudengoi]
MAFLGVLLEDFEDKMSFNEASLEFDTEALLKYYEAHLIRDRLHALQRYQWKGQKGGYGNWAEMQRWQEQWEQKLVELLRTRRRFSKMQSVWEALASLQPLDSPGAVAYARQKAAMYTRRKVEAEKNIKDVGHEELLGEMANVVAFVESERKKARKFIEAALACIS